MPGSPVRKTYTMLMVVDMARALKFYTSAFGASVAFDSPEWSELTLAGSTVALHFGGSGNDTRTGLGFEVDDLETAVQSVTEAGGRVTSPPKEQPAEGIRLAQVADTEGNLLSVTQLIN